MKKLSLLIFSMMMVTAAMAQFTITSSSEHLLLTGPQYNIDGIAIFNGIPVGATVNYTGGGNFKWSYTVAGETLTSTQMSVEAIDGVLYTVSINGVATHYIYVIDYSKYLASCSGIMVDFDDPYVCNITTVYISCNAPEMTYVDKSNTVRTIPRYFYIDYTTAAWDGTKWQDSAATVSAQVTGSVTSMSVSFPALLQDSYIMLYGDNFAVDMGLPIDSCGIYYTASAVMAYPTGTVIERDAKNEKDRKVQNAIEGSAPLVVQLKANVNPIQAPFIEWRISNVKDSIGYRRFADETVNYTFEETGDYKAKVIVKYDTCEYTETLNIKTLESFLEAPNVFTPNDDGINDEFRVAYKSIQEYHIWIYNRWGRLVYSSTDPGKGWDGRINGKPAAVGTYYYVINAYGEDTDDKGKRKHYKLSGDCNLLR